VVTIGFIVEGATEKVLIESKSFTDWAKQQGIKISRVVNAQGNGNLSFKRLPAKIDELMNGLNMGEPNYIVILTDLECEENTQIVKNRIGTEYTNLIFIAVKAIEAWFLADTEALSQWLKTNVFEEYPEKTEAMPFERLRELSLHYRQRGISGKLPFTKSFIQKWFDFERAANHPNCPSAKAFHDGLIELAK
jgi:hypothetical protein